MEILGYSIAGIIVFLAIYLSVYTEILKDTVITKPGDIPVKTYSFARTQGLWWTTIIATCFIIGFGVHGTVIPLNATCLALLGIGIGTTAIGKTIDNYDLKSGFIRYQDIKTTRNFFVDILSDETGITVYRYQSLIFNLIYTLVFLIEFFKKIRNAEMKFPDFEPETLALLGISASVYLGLKATENQKSIIAKQNRSDTSLTEIDRKKAILNASDAENDFRN